MSEQRPNPDPTGEPRDLSRDGLSRESGPILSEEALLDWVDGRVSSTDAEMLAGASGRRGLAARVSQMQANKRALNSLAMEKAPADLADRVVQALEREALLALSDGQPTGALPISTYEAPARGRRRNNSPSWRMPLAMAAGLALIVGGVSFMAYNVLAPSNSSTMGPLAHNDGPNVLPPDLPTTTGPVGSALAEAMSAEQGDPVAMAANDAGAPELAEAAHAGVETFVASKSAARDLARAAPAVIDDARALELARERRLAVQVRGASTRALALLSQNSGRVWSLEPGMDEGVKVALDAKRQERYDRIIALAAKPEDGAVAMSAEDRTRLALRSLAGVAPLSFQPPTSFVMAPAPAISYTADLPDGASSLLSLKATLSARLGGSVIYVELDEAQPIDPAAAAMRTLWWTEPTSAWSPRVRVPVYIEPLQ